MKITVCDVCDERITTVIYKKPVGDEDFCSLECLNAIPECPHEENISDAANGRDTARFICKACGYDRVEAVEVIAV